MKLLLLALTLLVGTQSFGDDELVEQPYHYSLLPAISYHFGISEMGGPTSSGVDQGPLGMLRLKVERDGYFFDPDIELMEVVGLDKSPITVWGLGFITGGRLKSLDIDVYAGFSYRHCLKYKADDGLFGRLGLAWGIGGGDLQIYVEGLFGQFSATTNTAQVSYYYYGPEVGLQFPIEL